MAHYAKQHDVDALAANATLLLDDDHLKFEAGGGPNRFSSDEQVRWDAITDERKRALATSPWQRGSIVFIDLGDGRAPGRALIERVDIKWSDHSYEYVNHAIGYIERKGGGFSRMVRHIYRGQITRGYQKARELGLLATATEVER